MDPYRTIGRTMNILIGKDSQISHRTGVTVLMHNFDTYLDSGKVKIHKNTKSPFCGFLLQPHFEAALLYNITANSVIFHLTLYKDHKYLLEVNLRPQYNYQMRNMVIISWFWKDKSWFWLCQSLPTYPHPSTECRGGILGLRPRGDTLRSRKHLGLITEGLILFFTFEEVFQYFAFNYTICLMKSVICSF